MLLLNLFHRHVQFPVKIADLPSVHQSVVAQYRDRHGHAAALRLILSPNETGIAVRRDGRRLSHGSVMHPRHGGHIEIWQQVRGILLDGAVTGRFLLHRAGRLQERHEIVPAVQLAIGVSSILPRHGVGSGTPRIFQNLPIFDPLTEGGHPVGRSGCTPQKRQEERHAAFLLPMIKLRNIHLNRHAHIGIAHGQKIVKVLRPGIGAQVDMSRNGCLNGHDGSSVFWDWLLSDFIIPPSLLPCQRHFPT